VDQGGNFPVKFSGEDDTTLHGPKSPAELTVCVDFPPDSAAEKATNPLDQRSWMLLNGLATHDISAMRELIGMPQKVLKAARSPDGLFTWVMFQ
jgi:hypothetical protein